MEVEEGVRDVRQFPQCMVLRMGWNAEYVYPGEEVVADAADDPE